MQHMSEKGTGGSPGCCRGIVRALRAHQVQGTWEHASCPPCARRLVSKLDNKQPV